MSPRFFMRHITPTHPHNILPPSDPICSYPHRNSVPAKMTSEAPTLVNTPMAATPRPSASTTPSLLQPSEHPPPNRRSNRASARPPAERSIWDRLGIHPLRGIITDTKRRVPYYWSDWTDAWDYHVVPATIFIFFAKCVHHTLPCPSVRNLIA
ncbi:hypothetical protein SAICODRAFT_124297 [Saitoella complicata NRRL Y-17804]|uniref:uncharacterized protein n=1 Tax=Saitoella complicata (strain BCRC 22490 / CBS 7301 / JCM 7358 / NBRC 10748 / NRRL Y-17804) TaxID=698492 RepID=UPI0008674D57|nr:uncharacterized protein SAICODRAFT_124297 [Saitoella complicata NRRL Y-17804]ODQ53075.1 hypothetical protein SAICODRAFT_124297 [Saitoella complicata NRRL Y-17804]